MSYTQIGEGINYVPHIGAYVPTLARSATIYVTADGNDANDGLSWNTGKATVQAGINALANSTGSDPYGKIGTVRVGPGTWNVASAQRTDTGCTITNGSATVLDPSITAADVGSLVYNATGLPYASGNIVGWQIVSVNPGVSFTVGSALAASVSNASITVYRPAILLPPGVKLVGSGSGGASGRVGGVVGPSPQYPETLILDSGSGITVAVQSGFGEADSSNRFVLQDIAIWGSQYGVSGSPGAVGGSNITTSAASGTGTPTTLSVNALPSAIASGVSFQLSSDVNNPKITFTLTAPAEAGATTLDVSTSGSIGVSIASGSTLWFNSNLQGVANMYGLWYWTAWQMSLVRCDISYHAQWGTVCNGNGTGTLVGYDTNFSYNGTPSGNGATLTGGFTQTSGAIGPQNFFNCLAFENFGTGFNVGGMNLIGCSPQVNRATPAPNSGSGVIMSPGLGGDVSLIGCWLEQNAGSQVVNLGRSGVVKSCTFQGANVSQYGIKNAGNSLSVEDCTFEGHTALSINQTNPADIVRWSNCYSTDPWFVAVTGAQTIPVAQAPYHGSTGPLGNMSAVNQTTLGGTTAGTAVSAQPETGFSYKKFLVYLNGYENTTATAQTITFPTAFTETPYLAHDDSGGSTVSTTTLTLPTSMASAKTGWIVVEGY